MSLECPRCSNRVSGMDLLKFLRMTSIMCLECTALLSLDEKGRSALTTSIVGAVLVAIIARMVAGTNAVAVVAGIVGLYLGLQWAAREGSLRPSPDDPANKSS